MVKLALYMQKKNEKYLFFYEIGLTNNLYKYYNLTESWDRYTTFHFTN